MKRSLQRNNNQDSAVTQLSAAPFDAIFPKIIQDFDNLEQFAKSAADHIKSMIDSGDKYIIVQPSFMGSGKSTVTKAILQHLDIDKVQALTNMVSLKESFKRQFQGEVETVQKVFRNKAAREVFKKPKHVLVIDEWLSFLKTITSTGTLNEREVEPAFNLIVEAINQTPVLFAMEAGFKDKDYQRLRDIFPDRKIIVMPLPSRGGKKQFNVHTSTSPTMTINAAVERLWANYLGNKKTYLNVDSVATATLVKHQIIQKGVDKKHLFLMKATNKNFDQSKQFLANPDEFLEKTPFKIVIATPVIKYGNSIESHFDEVISISTGVISASEFLQASLRVRPVNTINVYLAAPFKSFNEANLEAPKLSKHTTFHRQAFLTAQEKHEHRTTHFDILFFKKLDDFCHNIHYKIIPLSFNNEKMSDVICKNRQDRLAIKDSEVKSTYQAEKIEMLIEGPKNEQEFYAEQRLKIKADLYLKHEDLSENHIHFHLFEKGRHKVANAATALISGRAESIEVGEKKRDPLLKTHEDQVITIRHAIMHFLHIDIFNPHHACKECYFTNDQSLALMRFLELIPEVRKLIADHKISFSKDDRTANRFTGYLLKLIFGLKTRHFQREAQHKTSAGAKRQRERCYYLDFERQEFINSLVSCVLRESYDFQKSAKSILRDIEKDANNFYARYSFLERTRTMDLSVISNS